MKILINSISCQKCGSVLVSTHRHDFVKCRCKKDWVAVDGGKDYLKRTGIDYKELSTVEMDINILWQMMHHLRECEKTLNAIDDTYIESMGKYTYDVVKDLTNFLKTLEHV